MPNRKFECKNCGRGIDVVNIPNDINFIDCPGCGSLVGQVEEKEGYTIKYRRTMRPGTSVHGTQKQWSGRKHVNFEVDDRRTIAQKQVALMVNSGRIDKFFEKTKRPRQARKHYLDAIGKMMKNAPPIKVDL